MSRQNIVCSMFLISILFAAGCSKNSGETAGSGHEDHAAESESEMPHKKMVYLNQAQYINAGIDTGWFEIRNCLLRTRPKLVYSCRVQLNPLRLLKVSMSIKDRPWLPCRV